MNPRNSCRRPWLKLGAGAIAAAVVVVAGLGCADVPDVTEPTPRITLAQVTPSLAASLTRDGHFVLPAALENPPGEITESQARTIAERYVRDMSPSLASSWSDDHGANVNSAALTPCERAVYAANPYASLTGADVAEITVRTFGAHWVVPMCAGMQPQIVVSFSSLATELPAGLTTVNQPLPWDRADIRSFGVPIGTSAALFTPEGAAMRAYAAAGKRVSKVPELIMNTMPVSPVLVRWRIELEAPTKFRGAQSGTTRELTTVISGFGQILKEFGLFDLTAQGDPAALNWTDAVTKKPFTLVLSPRAAAVVEPITREDR